MKNIHPFDQLLNAQQSELDCALIYQALSRKAKDPKDSALFHTVASDEIRHAAVFHSMTGEELRPRKWTALLIPFLYRVLGRKRMIPLLAMGKYIDHQRYEVLGRRYARIRAVSKEEKLIGQRISALLY